MQGDRARRRRHKLRPVSRSNGHRSPLAALDRIAELAQALAPLLEDAADARKSGGLEFVGRGSGFTDADPTGTAALDPTRRQMRSEAAALSEVLGRAPIAASPSRDDRGARRTICGCLRRLAQVRVSGRVRRGQSVCPL